MPWPPPCRSRSPGRPAAPRRRRRDRYGRARRCPVPTSPTGGAAHRPGWVRPGCGAAGTSGSAARDGSRRGRPRAPSRRGTSAPRAGERRPRPRWPRGRVLPERRVPGGRRSGRLPERLIPRRRGREWWGSRTQCVRFYGGGRRRPRGRRRTLTSQAMAGRKGEILGEMGVGAVSSGVHTMRGRRGKTKPGGLFIVSQGGQGNAEYPQGPPPAGQGAAGMPPAGQPAPGHPAPPVPPQAQQPGPYMGGPGYQPQGQPGPGGPHFPPPVGQPQGPPPQGYAGGQQPPYPQQGQAPGQFPGQPPFPGGPTAAPFPGGPGQPPVRGAAGFPCRSSWRS